MLASSDSYSSQDSAMDSVPSNKTVADTIGLKSFYTASNEMKVFKTYTLGLLNHLLICPHNYNYFFKMQVSVIHDIPF